MNALTDILDVANLSNHIDAGNIAEKVGPSGHRLFNYTARAQYSRAWDHETMTCRGLVIDGDHQVVARPFPKFFNLHEHASPDLPDLPVEPFTVAEKLDGSLIVVGSDTVTTRGSFDSRQAGEARRMLAGRTPPLGTTWLLELVAPWNRVVVPYEYEALVHLATIDNATGHDVVDPSWVGARAATFDFPDLDTLCATLPTLPDREEGYVIRFASGMRAKAKGAEYTRLHRLVTQVSPRTIHEMLADGRGIDELLDRVPDEFYAWVRETAGGILSAYNEIHDDVSDTHARIAGLQTRKDQALAIKDHPHKGAIFAMLDGKDHTTTIWRSLRPRAADPFVDDTAA